jgi:hypothetical protein
MNVGTITQHRPSPALPTAEVGAHAAVIPSREPSTASRRRVREWAHPSQATARAMLWPCPTGYAPSVTSPGSGTGSRSPGPPHGRDARRCEGPYRSSLRRLCRVRGSSLLRCGGFLPGRRPRLPRRPPPVAHEGGWRAAVTAWIARVSSRIWLEMCSSCSFCCSSSRTIRHW